jgi:mono/diheme cytochrome c family protein
MLKGLILGILLGILLIAGGVYFYFSSGRAPVATSANPIPFERTFARIGLHAYLDKLPHPKPQVPANDVNLMAGARVYKEQCAVCHGLPGEPKGAIQMGMYPVPPQLFHGTGGKRDSHDGDAGVQGAVDGNADLAGLRAGKKRGQDFRLSEERARGGRLHSDGYGDAGEQTGSRKKIERTALFHRRVVSDEHDVSAR